MVPLAVAARPEACAATCHLHEQILYECHVSSHLRYALSTGDYRTTRDWEEYIYAYKKRIRIYSNIQLK